MDKNNVFFPAVEEGLNVAKSLLYMGLIFLVFAFILGVVIKIYGYLHFKVEFYFSSKSISSSYVESHS